jgi:hypothetical protein
MADSDGAFDPQPAIGVVLQDAAGQYYAIEQAALLQYRVAEHQTGIVEAMLKGADARDVAPAVDRSRHGASDGSPMLGVGPPVSGWRFRTSRRSDRLWLIFA